MKNITEKINQLEWLIQLDLGHRGIHHIPGNNLYTHSQGNLFKSIKYLADNQGGKIGIVTGFFIPTAKPAAPETDGPPGALFLARGLCNLDYSVLLITDSYCTRPLEQGLDLFSNQTKNLDLAIYPELTDKSDFEIARDFLKKYEDLNCLISIERVGPCYTMEDFLAQHPKPTQDMVDLFNKNGPGKNSGNYLNMRGVPIGKYSAPIHDMFDKRNHPDNSIFTIGIGDGGNEIGMGSIPWQVIADNILNGLGGKIACSIKTDSIITAGVSNWAGYALTAGLYSYLNKKEEFLDFFKTEDETKLMEIFHQTQSAVDGVLGYPSMSVDGIKWETHLKIMEMIL